jgi:hypothetical protein
MQLGPIYAKCLRRVNLTAACRVHLIEPHWNPMVEEQALNRVHRIGQDRDVFVYRYIANNSIEEVRPWSYSIRLKHHELMDHTTASPKSTDAQA